MEGDLKSKNHLQTGAHGAILKYTEIAVIR